MSELEDSFAKLLGRQPTDADRQQLYRVRDALGLKNNDALWLVLMALQSYDDKYREIPAQIEKAAAAAAKSAAEHAQAQINSAVASLVPSVEKAVASAAASAVKRLQLGKSLMSLWAGMLVLACMFALGWIYGAGVLSAYHNKHITGPQLLNLVGWGLGIGAAIPGLIALSAIDWPDEQIWLPWVAMIAAIGGLALLALKVWFA